jgi:hypothetical protein
MLPQATRIKMKPALIKLSLRRHSGEARMTIFSLLPLSLVLLKGTASAVPQAYAREKRLQRLRYALEFLAIERR